MRTSSTSAPSAPLPPPKPFHACLKFLLCIIVAVGLLITGFIMVIKELNAGWAAMITGIILFYIVIITMTITRKTITTHNHTEPNAA